MEFYHGGDIYSQKILWDHSVNSNPLGAPEGVREAVRRSAAVCERYPDRRCRSLTRKLAERHQVPEEALLCGNGAADLLVQMVFGERPQKGWLLAPTFSGYEQALTGGGVEISYLALRKEADLRPDVHRLIGQIFAGWQDDRLIGRIFAGWPNDRLQRRSGMSRAVDPRDNRASGQPGGLPDSWPLRPGYLFLCNPNNPTGLALERREVAELAAFAEGAGIRLVVDECFLDFLEDPERYTMVPELERFPHMVVLKAFTKLYGMAGLRLGYCMTMDRQLFKAMDRVRQPWPVSLTAQMAGEAALEEEAYRIKTRQVVREGREQLSRGLKALGFWVCPSQANYLLFKDLRPGAEDGRLGKACLEQKLLLRSCRDYHGLDGSYYRTCVGQKEDNDRLLAMLGRLCG